MQIELINTGTELMLGRLMNTHHAWLCQQFTDLGQVVCRQTAIPDTASVNQQCVKEALSVTGIADPSGGSESKPVGTLYMAIASATGTQVLREFNAWEREVFKFVTSQQILNLLRIKIQC